MEGALTTAGALPVTGAGATGPTEAEGAEVDPRWVAAVTTTRTEKPTSAAASLYVLPTAPPIDPHPDDEQRSHA
jgi:hypothetical protein